MLGDGELIMNWLIVSRVNNVHNLGLFGYIDHTTLLS